MKNCSVRQLWSHFPPKYGLIWFHNYYCFVSNKLISKNQKTTNTKQSQSPLTRDYMATENVFSQVQFGHLSTLNQIKINYSINFQTFNLEKTFNNWTNTDLQPFQHICQCLSPVFVEVFLILTSAKGFSYSEVNGPDVPESTLCSAIRQTLNTHRPDKAQQTSDIQNASRDWQKN